MATFAITVPDADVPRLQAAATAAGSTPKAMIISYLQSLVQSYEVQQHQQQYAAAYTPIGGS